MLNTLKALAAPAVMQRLTLLLNHVLASEAVASYRMKSHSGRRIVVHFDRWPSLLPAVPPLAFLVTPAGLLEWQDTPQRDATPADLQVTIDASNPALMMVKGLVGERPTIDISGDAAFAGDVNWLLENLRWEIQDDLARVVGNAPARELSRFGGFIAAAFRAAVQRVSRMAAGSPEPPAR